MTPPKLCGDCGTQMDVMPELYALPGLDPTSAGLQFNFSRAVPITVYICPNCGRFKFMSALLLGNVEAAAQEAAAREAAAQQAAAQQATQQAAPEASANGAQTPQTNGNGHAAPQQGEIP